MKRFFLLSITFVLTFVCLTGCIIIPLYKNYEIPADTVSSIEIYNTSQCEVAYSEFFKTEPAVYQIPDDQTADFLSDLSQIRFSDAIVIVLAAMDPSFYYGEWVTRINYTDGTYEMISCAGYGETYDQNDNHIKSHHYGCDDDEWNNFIGKYLPTDVFEEREQEG